MKILACVIALAILAIAPAFGQANQNPVQATDTDIDFETARLSRHINAVRITEEIVVDGLLNEAAWDLAEPATDFVQRVPRNGSPETERTEARFIYDDENLYVGFLNFDSDPENLVVNEIVEDFGFGQSDIVTVTLDTLHDRRSAIVFVSNPEGARRDGQVMNDGQSGNWDWDGLWYLETTRNDEGWIAEFQIPFKTLRFTDAPTQVWGLNMTRSVRRRNEESTWSPIPTRYFATRVSMAGTLGGLEGVRQGMNLRFKPYVIGGFSQTRPTGAPFDDFETDDNFNGGFDLKYSLTPSMTLDATYRTDFAQVEVDQQQVNLTRFSLFFPEKREFFLENAGTFGFSTGGNVIPFFSRRIGLSDAGTPIPIVGGGRVSGTAGQFDIGALTMKTESEGSTPSNNYLVGRLKRNLLSNSWVGGIVTNRDSSVDGDYNRVFGADAHFEFSRRLEFDAYLLGSDTPGLEGDNLARRFQTAWRDDELTLRAEYAEVQTNFNPEVGFVRRPDNAQYAGQVRWAPQFQTSDTVRDVYVDAGLNYFEGSNDEIETREETLYFGVEFENGGWINFGIRETFDRLVDDFQIRSGITIPAGDYSYRDYSADFRTDQTEKISGSAGITWGDFWNGNRRSYNTGIRWSPSYHFNVDLEYRHNRVELPAGNFTTDLVSGSFIYAFTPRMFLNTLIQYNADTNEVSSNIRFNIIHRPLSDLFIVYNDRRDTDNGQTIERALTVKFTNLFSF